MPAAQDNIPDHVIEIPGVGNVRFPGSLTGDALNAAAKKVYEDGQRTKETDSGDPVAALLQRAPLSRAQRADLWDMFHAAANEDDLAAKLNPLSIPKPVKADLWDLKAAHGKPASGSSRVLSEQEFNAVKQRVLDAMPPGLSEAEFNRQAGPRLAQALAEAEAQPASSNAIRRYKVTDPATGKTLVLSGDSPPTEQELEEIFRTVGEPAAHGARTWTDTATDVAVGAVKGFGNTAYGLGKLLHDYTPIGRISDAIQPGAFEERNKPPELTPTNTPQKIGYYGEQIGEFFTPTGVTGKLAKAAEVGKSGVLSLAQGASPTAAGISAGLTALMPGAGATARASDALEHSAQKTMAQALGATKEWAKVEAAKLAPQMLQRGIGGSRPAMLATAKEAAKRVGANLEQAYQAAAAAGQTVPTNIVQGNLQLAADALKVRVPSGALITVPGTERVVSKLTELADFVASLGPDIPVDQAAQIKRTWDHVVSKAGLFGPKATASATDSADAWAIREAAGSFRTLLNSDPTIQALNKELSFWTGLKNVLKETEKRTQAQRGGLTDAIRGAGGAAAGAITGGPLGAAAGGFATQQLSKLMASPAWKSQVSAPMKHALADALASGSAGRIISAVSRITASLPAQWRPGTTQP